MNNRIQAQNMPMGRARDSLTDCVRISSLAHGAIAIHRKIIFIETNEVPFRVIDRFCKDHPDSSLARNLHRCSQFTTRDEPQNPNRLSEPTSSWPTVHRGVNEGHHRIYDFNQDLADTDERYPPIWKILASRDVLTGVFGSFHSYQSFPGPGALQSNRYAFYVPDVFSPDGRSYPESLRVFQDLNLSMTRDSARNVSSKLHWGNGFRLLANAPRLGIKVSTLARLCGQLLQEQRRPWLNTRRRSHQATVAFDLFMRQLETTKPAFATFFINHIAAAMHRYWAASFPEDYADSNVEPAWIRRYCGEIDYAMATYDRLFDDLLRFADNNTEYKLVFASGIGQAARFSRSCRTELFIVSWSRFMAAMGIDSSAWSILPAMIPMFNVIVSKERAGAFRDALQHLSIGGEAAIYTEYENGLFALHLGQADLEDGCIVYRGAHHSVGEFGLQNIEIDDRSARSGYHVPIGSLLVYDPLKAPRDGSRALLSVLDICPSILRNFDIPVPPYMSGQCVNAICT
jgi:hypothetical protein